MKRPALPPSAGRIAGQCWLLLAALVPVVFCSCRVGQLSRATGPCPERVCRGPGVSAAAGPSESALPAALVPPKPRQLPLPHNVAGPWTPDGLAQPWPENEYLHDGGDEMPEVVVADDWSIYGLETEDTVAHFDTVDGRTLVTPSNRVHLYAPRFGAVRTVVGAELNEQVAGPVGVARELPPQLIDRNQETWSSLQNLQPEGQIITARASTESNKQIDGVASTVLVPLAAQDAYLPFENLSIIRSGVFEQREKARLATSIDAAIVWSHDTALQVTVDNRAASEVVGDRRAQATFRYDDLPGHPELRVIKVASTQFAQPGDFVDFTLRFDNTGDEPVGNVTLVDNLTTRLEFVEGSAQASLKSNFSTQANAVGSVVLRWEIIDPLDPGAGGIVRFRCRVR